MHLAERAVDGADCVLKVLDLGVMITDEDWQQWEPQRSRVV